MFELTGDEFFHKPKYEMDADGGLGEGMYGIYNVLDNLIKGQSVWMSDMILYGRTYVIMKNNMLFLIIKGKDIYESFVYVYANQSPPPYEHYSVYDLLLADSAAILTIQKDKHVFVNEEIVDYLEIKEEFREAIMDYLRFNGDDLVYFKGARPEYIGEKEAIKS